MKIILHLYVVVLLRSWLVRWYISIGGHENFYHLVWIMILAIFFIHCICKKLNFHMSKWHFYPSGRGGRWFFFYLWLASLCSVKYAIKSLRHHTILPSMQICAKMQKSVCWGPWYKHEKAQPNHGHTPWFMLYIGLIWLHTRNAPGAVSI